MFHLLIGVSLWFMPFFFEHLKPQLVTGWLVVSNPQVGWIMAMYIHFYYAKGRHVALVESRRAVASRGQEK